MLVSASLGQGLPNDECDGAFEVSEGTTIWDTTGATLSDESLDTCVSTPGMAQEDIWFQYTAGCSGVLTIDTCGSDVVRDTILAIYDGTSCSPLGPLIVCDDDGGDFMCGTFLSTVTVTVDAGDEVMIRVASWTGEPQGTGVLNIRCDGRPTNDQCEGAFEIFDGTTRLGATFDDVMFVPAVPGDVDGDCVVDAIDLVQVLADWGVCDVCLSNANGDDAVDFADLLVVLANWGPTD